MGAGLPALTSNHMNINIKATGIKLTDAIREYALKKISSLEKYIYKKESAIVQIEVGKSSHHHKTGEVFKAEVRISGGGLDVYAVSEAEDLYSAIDLVQDEVARGLVSTRGRHIKLLRQGERAVKYMMKGLAYPFKKMKKFRKETDEPF